MSYSGATCSEPQPPVSGVRHSNLKVNNVIESHSVVSDSLWAMDYIVYGILQARILEWVDFPFSRGPSQPRDQIQVSCITGRFFTRKFLSLDIWWFKHICIGFTCSQECITYSLGTSVLWSYYNSLCNNEVPCIFKPTQKELPDWISEKILYLRCVSVSSLSLWYFSPLLFMKFYNSRI